MKKVLFTATVDSHIELFHLPYLKYFKEQGYEVHVATATNKSIPYCDKKIEIPFERSPFKLNNIKAIFALKKVIDKEKYTLIHTHTPMGSVITRIAAIQSRKKNKTKVMYTAHGFHFYTGAPVLNWILFYPVEKFLSKYTDTLILINKEDYYRAKKNFKNCLNIKYVRGIGLDEEKFNFQMTKKEKIEFRKKLGIKKDDFVMIYPAELSKRKNQEWLIKSLEKTLKENPNMHVLLPGRDNLNGKLQQMVKVLQLEEHIHFLGFTKEIPSLLKISDIAISTSKQEGLPVNIMEAMYEKLPIIATKCRGNKDLVKNNKNGYLIEQYDQETFIKRVKKLDKEQEKNKKFSIENKKRIEKYLLKNVLQEMIKIYKENLNENKD